LTLEADRLAIAESIRRELAVENRLSAPQARSFVRGLQTSWQVPAIFWRPEESDVQLVDARRLLHAASVFRRIEGIRSPGARDCYRRAGELLEWLCRADDPLRDIVPIELLAAAAFQLGGLPAMANGLIAQATIKHAGAAFYSYFLKADFDAVMLESAEFWRTHADLTDKEADERLLESSDFSWYCTVQLVRSLGLIADSLRRGDDLRLNKAKEKLAALDAMAARTFSDDASLVVGLLYAVAESYSDASIYGPIRTLAGDDVDKQVRMGAFARKQYRASRGILWASQRVGLDRLSTQSSFALCTPTGSGKTLVANLALIKELLTHASAESPALALYLVPSRALAGEVEARLSAQLGDDFIITGLYGGADWGITDYWLTAGRPTVLIATVEKADALMRYMRIILVSRLRLLILDEAHQVVPEDNETSRASFADHANRPIRLENLVSRLLTQKPEVARIALTAVAGGASGPVARWIEGRAEAEAVATEYRSTRQIIGVLETRPRGANQMLLEVVNGRRLFVRDRDDPVYLPLRIPEMVMLPAAMRGSLNRYNELSVLWTALHLVDNDRRILISVAQRPEQTMRWYVEALALPTWSQVPPFSRPIGQKLERYEEALETCADYCGADSFEYILLGKGIATSHGQMPQRLRRLMTEMIEARICPITIATATLTEGVNLPFDLVFITSLKRRSYDLAAQKQVDIPISVSEFRNLAGRAGRPGVGKGIEGIALVAIPTQHPTTASSQIRIQRRQIASLQADYESLLESLLRDAQPEDRTLSPLGLLLDEIRRRAGHIGVHSDEGFFEWLNTALPEDITPDAGVGATHDHARLADDLDELDGFLLTVLAEAVVEDSQPMTGPTAELHLQAIWTRTFSAVAAAQEAWLERAFIQRGRAVVEVAYPEAAERARLYQYGFTPHIGRRFERVATAIEAVLAEGGTYGINDSRARLAKFIEVGDLLAADRGFGFRIRSTKADTELLDGWREVLAWWMQQEDAVSPPAAGLRAWQRFVVENLEFRLGVAIGAVVSRRWSLGAPNPLAVPNLAEWKATTGLPWFAFWARELLRWGTHDPFIAFALAQGLVKTRDAGRVMRANFEQWLRANIEDVSPEDYIDPQNFARWGATLSIRQHPALSYATHEVQLAQSIGRRQLYNVFPINDGPNIHWFDAAGYKLASSKSEDPSILRPSLRDDFQLILEAQRARVIRV